MRLTRIDRVLSRGKPEQAKDEAAALGRSEQDVAGLIGERFETIQDSLDQLSEMAQRFGTFETLLGQLRDPLEAEFRSRRDNHVELVNLRNANSAATKQVGLLTAEVRKLSARRRDHGQSAGGPGRTGPAAQRTGPGGDAAGRS
jgi:crescentin